MITRMKLRTAKHPKPGKEAARTPEELAEFSEGLLCLTGDEDGPLAHGLRKQKGARRWSGCSGSSAQKNVYLELQRHFDRDEEARNQAVIELSRDVGCAAGRDQRRLLRRASAARTAGRVHLPAPQDDAGARGPAAGTQLGALSEIRPKR